MRVLWIVGGHEDVRLQFEKHLTVARYGVSYLVRRAEELEEIPEAHLRNPGVVVCIDAFHPTLGGFEGMRRIRERGFTGTLFLLGEPAPEFAKSLWEELGIAGFLPPIERLDVSLASGLIHYKLYFEGTIDAAKFLLPSGRASSETISSVAELNAFATKLASFVGRFGLDLQQLKKIIMGLTVPHIKVGPQGPSVEPVFTIVYGIDPKKLVLGVSSYSRGASQAVLRQEMVAALSGLQETRSPVSSILPEVHHVARATQNVMVFAGHAKTMGNSTDPMYVLTTLLFPSDASSRQKSESAYYHATLGFVASSEEMSETEARLEVDSAAPSAPSSGDDASSAELPAPEAALKDETTLDAVDLEKILSEPKIIGDAPGGAESVDPPGPKLVPVPSAGHEPLPPPTAAVTPPGSAPIAASGEAAREIDRLKALCAALSFDVQRLLRERREPSTDKELRESFRELEERFRKLTKERASLQEKLDEKDKQIELLKAQVEALRRSAA